MENQNKVGLIIGALGLGFVAFVLFMMLGPFAFIGPGERGVEVDRGRVTGKVYSEGWYVYNTFTKDIIKYDVRTHTDEADASAASNDQQDVSVKVAITYRLDGDKVGEILRTIGRVEDMKSKIIEPQVQESVKAAVAKHNIEEMLDKRVEIKQQIFDDLSTRFMKYGVVLQEVAIKDVGFSKAFEEAIEHKVIAEQQKQQAEFEAQSTIKRAEAKAREQELLQTTLSDAVLKRLAIEKWNGAFPQYFGGGVLPFLDIAR